MQTNNCLNQYERRSFHKIYPCPIFSEKDLVLPSALILQGSGGIHNPVSSIMNT